MALETKVAVLKSDVKKPPLKTNVRIIITKEKVAKISFETLSTTESNLQPLSVLKSNNLDNNELCNKDNFQLNVNIKETKDEYMKKMSVKSLDELQDRFFRVTEKRSISVLKLAGYKEIHYFMKNQTRYVFCPYNDCLNIFTDIVHVKRHLLEFHKIRPYVCDYKNCKWTFVSSSKLDSHRSTHTDNKTFTCPIKDCAKRFTTISNLRHHQKHIHDTKPEFFCIVETCLKAFHTQRALDVHSALHQGCDPSYRCDYGSCGKSFVTKNALFSHMRTHQHDVSSLVCQWEGCNKIFDVPCRLREHMRCHTGEKPYVCSHEGCNWSFMSASKLKRHMASHLQERKYKCTVADCSKIFLRKQHLSEHILRHTCQERFSCPVEDCNSKFAARSSVYVHFNKVHKNNNEDGYVRRKRRNNKNVYSEQQQQQQQHDNTHDDITTTPFTEVDTVTLLTSEEDGSSYLLTDSPNFRDIILPQMCNMDTTPTEKHKCDVRKGSARTSYTYNDLMDEKRRETKNKMNDWESVKEVDSMVPTDGILGSDQAILMDELYPQDLPVLLLESTNTRHSEYEASTINLRDLE